MTVNVIGFPVVVVVLLIVEGVIKQEQALLRRDAAYLLAKVGIGIVGAARFW